MACATNTEFPLMTAGACFMSGPAEGALRLVVGVILPALDDGASRRGLLVQESVATDDDGYDCEWRTVCPLTDAHFMVDNCPTRWDRASRHLRDMIERDEPITLDVERAALVKAGQ